MEVVHYTTYTLLELAQEALQSAYTEEVKQAMTTLAAELPTQLYVRLLMPGSIFPTWLDQTFSIGAVHREMKKLYPGAQFLIQSSFDEYTHQELTKMKG